MAQDYREISKAKIAECRNIVISNYADRGYTIAQQLEIEEAGKTTSVFMKGAFHVDNIDGLYNVRDAINVAIKKIESGELEEDFTWDE